jgi:hypothetical protein
VKRNMIQGFQYFKQYSVPNSCNDWTKKAHTEAQPRREEACAVCAVKGWLENRMEVYLFKEACGTTTWARQFYARDNEDEFDMSDVEDGERASTSGGRHVPQGTLLVADDGNFCFGPKEKIHAILDVQRYAATWPLIPAEHLHASSVQHPEDVTMRWLLNTRRVKCAAPSIPDALPPSAGVGDKEATVWCCKDCVACLCKAKPTMPPVALANSFFLGRWHQMFRDATLAERILSSRARLIRTQLLLGRGHGSEVHQGMTGNSMIIH